MASLSRSIGQMADAVQAATNVLNSTSQTEKMWTRQVTCLQMASGMTNLGNFRLDVYFRGVRRKTKLVVLLDNPSGPKRHYRIRRWERATIRHAVRHSNPSPRKASALPRDWIGQLLHYGLFESRVMLLSTDRRIVKACKAILRRAIENSALVVPERIMKREERLRTQLRDKDRERESNNMPNENQERQPTADQNPDLETPTDEEGASRTQDNESMEDAMSLDQTDSSHTPFHRQEQRLYVATRRESGLAMPNFYVPPNQIPTPSSGTSFQPSDSSTDNGGSGEENEEHTQDDASVSELDEISEGVDESCSDSGSEDSQSEG